jgi:hypothetical protein
MTAAEKDYTTEVEPEPKRNHTTKVQPEQNRPHHDGAAPKLESNRTNEALAEIRDHPTPCKGKL